MSFTGSCLCGAVRYVADSEPKAISKCYCKDCQKESGTGHITVVAVPDASLRVTGQVREYSKPGSSGQPVVRTFCPMCGTTLFGRPTMLKGVTMIRAGTLDEMPSLKASMAVFASRAPQWDRPPADVQLFAELPPRRYS